MKKIVFAILIGLLLISCSDSSDLGDGYSAFTTGAELRAIGKNFNNSIGSYSVNISGHVLDYNHDKQFIIALQLPQDSLFKRPDFTKLNTWARLDSLSRKTDYKYYYIINKQQDSTYGPLNSRQYSIMRIKLNVPNSLRLKNGS